MDYAAIGQRVRSRRKELKLTQAELAKRIGLSTSALGRIERGTQEMSGDTLVKLCHALDTLPSRLVVMEEEPLEIPWLLRSAEEAEKLHSWEH